MGKGWCDHMINRHQLKGPTRCDKRARFHYRSTTGVVVELCGRHANAEAHRWKNPRPITEIV